MKVAVLGYGTVGVGVYEMLQAAKDLEAGPVLVRPGKEDKAFKVSRIEDITGDPSVDAVAEVMGGVEPAFTYAMAAIRAGKHFVTSNKALVAAKGVELNRAAREAGVSFLFSAACGGGVPFLHNLARAVETRVAVSPRTPTRRKWISQNAPKSIAAEAQEEITYLMKRKSLLKTWARMSLYMRAESRTGLKWEQELLSS